MDARKRAIVIGALLHDIGKGKSNGEKYDRLGQIGE